MAHQRKCHPLLLVLIACVLASGPLPYAAAQSSCGAWRGEPSDGRIQLAQVGESLGGECRGVFILSAETGAPGLGAHTLELHPTHTSNARIEWLPQNDPQESQHVALLVPSLELELHAFPIDTYSGAQILLAGDMTAASVRVDAAGFLLRTALALLDHGSCDSSEEQVANTATIVSPALEPVLQLVWSGDLVGARAGLRDLLPPLLEQSSASLQAEDAACAAESLLAAAGQPAILRKLEEAFLAWLPAKLFGYFEYQKQPAHLTLEYLASPVPTSTPAAATPEPASPAEREVLEVLRRYEEIRIRSHGPSHDITGLEEVLAESSLESHLGSVEWQRENNAYYLITVHESRVEEITVISPTRIDVLVDKLESREFYIDGKLGKNNTVYNDHYQVLYQFKLIDGSWYIVDRSVTTLPTTPTTTPAPVANGPGGVLFSDLTLTAHRAWEQLACCAESSAVVCAAWEPLPGLKQGGV